MKNAPEKLLVSTLIGLSALMPGVQGATAYAEPLQHEQQSGSGTVPFKVDPNALADSDELFAQYVDRAFGLGPRRRMLMAQRSRSNLTEKEQKVYNVLKRGIERIAAGETSDTRILVPFVEVYGESPITPEEMGVSAITSDNFKEYLMKDLDHDRVIEALLFDLPYDFYWYEKTAHGWYEAPGWDGSTEYSYGDKVGYTFKFPVSQDYRGAGEYTTDTAKTQAANAAAQKARAIIQAAASMPDWRKLEYYRKQICDLTSYNHEAAEATSPAYGDPWQLVYVFDENPSTNVVCEGYAKAFKYLCDNTEFASDEIEVNIMTGKLDSTSGGGDHMWNVVHMDDDKYYLVDLTGCDSGSVGYPDQLFFKGATTNTVAKDYTVTCKGGSSRYTYDDATMAAYTDKERTLSSTAYDPRIHSVKVVPGANMTKTTGSGAAEQDDVSGPMESVVYTADTGYYFPTSYSVPGKNGVTVTRDSATQITVLGTPTAHTTIHLLDATAKGKEPKPTANFSATGPDAGTLTNVASGMQYRVGTSGAWTDITGSSVTVSGLADGSAIQVRRPAGATTLESDVQIIQVVRFGAPYDAVAHDCETDANDDGQISGVSSGMEYRASGDTEWISATGDTIGGLRPGTYEVRRKATGNRLSSASRTLTIRRHISYTVTFQVKNGSWNEGGNVPSTVTLSGHEGDTLALDADQIPSAGKRPSKNYKAGSWDVTPLPGTAITSDTTYTYTYEEKAPIYATVTFQVVGGAFDDGDTGPKTVTLEGYEGDTLLLPGEKIPTAGKLPDAAHKAGGWDVTPTAGDDVTRGATYTYRYAEKAPIYATVTFHVVGGSWDNGSTEDVVVPLSGYEGDTLRLPDVIPTAGTMPADGYRQGGWDLTPVADGPVAGNRTYTYTYVNDESQSATVTFHVEGGSWDDGSTSDVVRTITGSRGEAPALTSGQVPAVGNMPADGFKEGAWDVMPTEGTPVTDGATYTYYYEAKAPIYATVTFQVVGGAFDDGTTGPKTVTLEGLEGDTLLLPGDEIPTAGKRPDAAHKAGDWDVTPVAGDDVTRGATYTYRYEEKAPISATVTFQVVGGSWDDGTKADKRVPVTGYEGETLRLPGDKIPGVGTQPDKGYEAGDWWVRPAAGDDVTGGATYTYAYDPKMAILRTLVFRVVGGSWDDGTTRPKSVTLEGYEGDTLVLDADQIPGVGHIPSSGYRAGSWDRVPEAGPVTTSATYTYTYERADDVLPVAPTPTVRSGLVANGTSLQLIEPMRTTAGMAQYALGTNAMAAPLDGWSTAVPSASEAGTYYVWYRVVDDAGDVVARPGCVRVIIADGSGSTSTPTSTSTVTPTPTTSYVPTTRRALQPFYQGWPLGIYDPFVPYDPYYDWGPRWDRDYYRSSDSDTSSSSDTSSTTSTSPATNATINRTTSPATDLATNPVQGPAVGTTTSPTPSITTGATSRPATRTTPATITRATTDTGSATNAGRATVRRLAGADRYATMAAIVDEAFPSADFVAVASGQSFADALVSATLAGIKDAPIIVTRQNVLQRDATAQVDRLKPDGAYVVGGSEAVTERAEEALRLSGSGNTDVTRVAGKSRQATSVAALREARKAGSTSDTIIVVSGHDFADALSISPWAYATKSAMLLTTADGRLTQEEVDAIKDDKYVKRVILVGGTSAVSDAVRGQLPDGIAVERVGGANRYETNRKVAEFAVANGMSWSTVAVATGRDYSDALAGSALIGKSRGVLLLADSADDPTIAAIRENAGKVDSLYVLGGENAVSASVESAVRTAVAG